MEIHIRNISPKHVAEIDKRCKQISKRLGKRYSRSDYINSLIENHLEKEYRSGKEDQFNEALNNVSITLERQENKLQEFIDVTNDLVRMLAEK